MNFLRVGQKSDQSILFGLWGNIVKMADDANCALRIHISYTFVNTLCCMDILWHLKNSAKWKVRSSLSFSLTQTHLHTHNTNCLSFPPFYSISFAFALLLQYLRHAQKNKQK